MPIDIDIEPGTTEPRRKPTGHFRWAKRFTLAVLIMFLSAPVAWIGLPFINEAFNPDPVPADAKADKLPVFQALAPQLLAIGFAPPPGHVPRLARVPVWSIQQVCSGLQNGTARLSALRVTSFDVRPDRCLLDIALLAPLPRGWDPESVIGTIFFQYRGDRFRGGRNLRMKFNLTKPYAAPDAYRRSLRLLETVAELAGFDLHPDMISSLNRRRSFRLSRNGINMDFLKERLSEGRYNLILSFERWTTGPAPCRFNAEPDGSSLPNGETVPVEWDFANADDDTDRMWKTSLGVRIESFVCPVPADTP